MFGLQFVSRNLKFFFPHTVQTVSRELENSGSKTIKYEKKLRQVCKFAQHSRQLRCLHSLSSILHLSDNKLKQNQRAGRQMFHPYDNCFSETEKKVERFLISINQSQMSAVFYLQSSPKEIRWCSRFELYWFRCKLLQMVCSSIGVTLRDFWEPGAPPPPSLQPHLLEPDLVREHLLDAVCEVDEALGAGVAHDALHVGVHLVDVLSGLGVPLLLLGQDVRDVHRHHVLKLSLLLEVNQIHL